MNPGIKNIAIMGSTGSIGTQTLDIVRRYPELFKITALTANRNWELLARQAKEFNPEMVVIADDAFYTFLKEALAETAIKVASGRQSLIEAATLAQTDVVVGALVGFSGLESTIAALNSGKEVALANKETLVVAGEIIDGIVKKMGKRILPVDSEHSAIFQCLQGENHNEIRSLILTASGGPFRNFTLDEMRNATISQALNHPNWDMGSKVTIDSASMLNKGFEMIEAKWLFDINPDNIKILVHPQSMIHSMVEFKDGSIKAQIGVPDMHIPISYALSYPTRLKCEESSTLPLSSLASLTFEEPDYNKFTLLKAAFKAIKTGGTAPAALNAANEVAVKAFLNERIRFTDIFDVVERTLDSLDSPIEATLENIFECHQESTNLANTFVKELSSRWRAED